MKRRSLLLSPLPAAFLCLSLALPPQSAYDRGSRVPAAGNGAASSGRSHALRVRNAGLEEPTPVTDELEERFTGNRAYRIDPDQAAAAVVQALADRVEPIGTRLEGNGLLTLRRRRVEQMLTNIRDALPQPPAPDPYSAGLEEPLPEELEEAMDFARVDVQVTGLAEGGRFFDAVYTPSTGRPVKGGIPISRLFADRERPEGRMSVNQKWDRMLAHGREPVSARVEQVRGELHFYPDLDPEVFQEEAQRLLKEMKARIDATSREELSATVTKPAGPDDAGAEIVYRLPDGRGGRGYLPANQVRVRGSTSSFPGSTRSVWLHAKTGREIRVIPVQVGPARRERQVVFRAVVTAGELLSEPGILDAALLAAPVHSDHMLQSLRNLHSQDETLLGRLIELYRRGETWGKLTSAHRVGILSWMNERAPGLAGEEAARLRDLFGRVFADDSNGRTTRSWALAGMARLARDKGQGTAVRERILEWIRQSLTWTTVDPRGALQIQGTTRRILEPVIPLVFTGRSHEDLLQQVRAEPQAGLEENPSDKNYREGIERVRAGMERLRVVTSLTPGEVWMLGRLADPDGYLVLGAMDQKLDQWTTPTDLGFSDPGSLDIRVRMAIAARLQRELISHQKEAPWRQGKEDYTGDMGFLLGRSVISHPKFSELRNGDVSFLAQGDNPGIPRWKPAQVEMTVEEAIAAGAVGYKTSVMLPALLKNSSYSPYWERLRDQNLAWVQERAREAHAAGEGSGFGYVAGAILWPAPPADFVPPERALSEIGQTADTFQQEMKKETPAEWALQVVTESWLKSDRKQDVEKGTEFAEAHAALTRQGVEDWSRTPGVTLLQMAGPYFVSREDELQDRSAGARQAIQELAAIPGVKGKLIPATRNRPMPVYRQESAWMAEAGVSGGVTVGRSLFPGLVSSKTGKFHPTDSSPFSQGIVFAVARLLSGIDILREEKSPGVWSAYGIPRDQAQGLITAVRSTPAGLEESLKTALTGPQQKITSVAISPNAGQVAAATAAPEYLLHFWGLSSGENQSQTGRAGLALVSRYRPDGRILVTGNKTGALIGWDTASRTQLWKVTGKETGGHQADILALQMARNGTDVVAVSRDGMIKQWEMPTGKLGEAANIPPLAKAAQVDLLDERMLLFVKNEQVFIYSRETGGPFKETRRLNKKGVVQASFHPTGRSVVTVDKSGAVEQWNLSDTKLLGTFRKSGDAVQQLLWSGAGDHLIAVAGSGRVAVWDTATQQVVQVFADPSGEVTAAAADPYGRFLVTAGADQQVRVWALPEAVSAQEFSSEPSLGQPRLHAATDDEIMELLLNHDAENLERIARVAGAAREFERDRLRGWILRYRGVEKSALAERVLDALQLAPELYVLPMAELGGFWKLPTPANPAYFALSLELLQQADLRLLLYALETGDSDPLTAWAAERLRTSTTALDEILGKETTVWTRKTVKPPVIQKEPTAVSLAEGGTAQFAAQAEGEELRYQWRRDGKIVEGAEGKTLVIRGVKPSDAGMYHVEIANAGGKVSSRPMELTVKEAPKTEQVPAPVIREGPKNQAVTLDPETGLGPEVTFTASANGQGTLSYQWQYQAGDGPYNDISGATEASYTIPSSALGEDRAGRYRVRVRNEGGEAQAAARLQVRRGVIPSAAPSDSTHFKTDEPPASPVPAVDAGVFQIQSEIRRAAQQATQPGLRPNRLVADTRGLLNSGIVIGMDVSGQTDYRAQMMGWSLGGRVYASLFPDPALTGFPSPAYVSSFNTDDLLDLENRKKEINALAAPMKKLRRARDEGEPVAEWLNERLVREMKQGAEGIIFLRDGNQKSSSDTVSSWLEQGPPEQRPAKQRALDEIISRVAYETEWMRRLAGARQQWQRIAVDNRNQVPLEQVQKDVQEILAQLTPLPAVFGTAQDAWVGMQRKGDPVSVQDLWNLTDSIADQLRSYRGRRLLQTVPSSLLSEIYYAAVGMAYQQQWDEMTSHADRTSAWEWVGMADQVFCGCREQLMSEVARNEAHPPNTDERVTQALDPVGGVLWLDENSRPVRFSEGGGASMTTAHFGAQFNPVLYRQRQGSPAEQPALVVNTLTGFPTVQQLKMYSSLLEEMRATLPDEKTPWLAAVHVETGEILIVKPTHLPGDAEGWGRFRQEMDASHSRFGGYQKQVESALTTVLDEFKRAGESAAKLKRMAGLALQFQGSKRPGTRNVAGDYAMSAYVGVHQRLIPRLSQLVGRAVRGAYPGAHGQQLAAWLARQMNSHYAALERKVPLVKIGERGDQEIPPVLRRAELLMGEREGVALLSNPDFFERVSVPGFSETALPKGVDPELLIPGTALPPGQQRMNGDEFRRALAQRAAAAFQKPLLPPAPSEDQIQERLEGFVAASLRQPWAEPREAEVSQFAQGWRENGFVEETLVSDLLRSGGGIKQSDFNRALRRRLNEQDRLAAEAARKAADEKAAVDLLAKQAGEARELGRRQALAEALAALQAAPAGDLPAVVPALSAAQKTAADLPADLAPDLAEAIRALSEQAVEKLAAREVDSHSPDSVRDGLADLGRLSAAVGDGPWSSALAETRTRWMAAGPATAVGEIQELYDRLLSEEETPIEENAIQQWRGWVELLPAEAPSTQETERKLRVIRFYEQMQHLPDIASAGETRIRAFLDEAAAFVRQKELEVHKKWILTYLAYAARKVMESIYQLEEGSDEQRQWLVTYVPLYDGIATLVLDELKGDSSSNALQWKDILRKGRYGMQKDIEDWTRIQAMDRANAEPDSRLKADQPQPLALQDQLVFTHQYSGRKIRVALEAIRKPSSNNVELAKFRVVSPPGFVVMSGNALGYAEELRKEGRGPGVIGWKSAVKGALRRHRKSMDGVLEPISEEIETVTQGGEAIKKWVWVFPHPDIEKWSGPKSGIALSHEEGEPPETEALLDQYPDLSLRTVSNNDRRKGSSIVVWVDDVLDLWTWKVAAADTSAPVGSGKKSAGLEEVDPFPLGEFEERTGSILNAQSAVRERLIHFTEQGAETVRVIPLNRPITVHVQGKTLLTEVERRRWSQKLLQSVLWTLRGVETEPWGFILQNEDRPGELLLNPKGLFVKPVSPGYLPSAEHLVAEFYWNRLGIAAPELLLGQMIYSDGQADYLVLFSA